jgi:hypothetical protein
MSAVCLALVALAISIEVALRARRIVRDRRDDQWADRTVAWLRGMRGDVDEWGALDPDFDDHVDRALAIVSGDEVRERRLARAVAGHPAGRQR